LSGIIIDEADGLPSSSIYRNRFGSLLRAYSLIGYSPERDYRYVEDNRALRALHPAVLAEVEAGIAQAGAHTEQLPSGLIKINHEFSASIVIVRCAMADSGTCRWHIRFDASLLPDITIVARMGETNRDILDYYILPSMDMTTERLRLAEANGVSLDCYRFDNLDYLFELCQRINLQEVA